MSAAILGEIPDLGDIIRLGASAGVQFEGHPINAFRVTDVAPALTDGWVYVTGWPITDDGIGTPRTEFVALEGVVITRREIRA